MMHRPSRLAAVLIALLIAPAVLAKAQVAVQGDAATLQNSFLSATVSLKQGGGLTSLAWRKGNVELIRGLALTEALDLPVGKQAPLADVAFKVVEHSMADDGVLVLEAELPDVSSYFLDDNGNPVTPSRQQELMYFTDVVTKGVTLRKTYTIPKSEARIKVTYRLTNGGKADTTVCLALGAPAMGVGRRYSLAVPAAAGAVNFPYRMSNDQFATSAYFTNRHRQHDFYALSDTWVAVMSTKGDGSLRWCDPRYVSFVRASVDGKRTAEIVTTELALKPGGSAEFDTWLVPFSGLPEVHAGGPSFAAAISLPAPKAGDAYAVNERAEGTLSICSAAYTAGSIALNAQRPDDRRAIRLAYKRAKLMPGDTYTDKIAFQVPREGAYKIDLEVKPGDITGSRTVAVGGAGAASFNELKVEKVGAVKRGIPTGFPPSVDWQPATDVPSPHVPFARPLAGGPVRALWLYPFYCLRDVPEIAQRLDMELDVAAMAVAENMPKSRKLEGVAPADEAAHLRVLLAKKHDVIIAGHAWNYWPADIRAEILRQVKEDGVGLLCQKVNFRDDALTAIAKQAKARAGEFPGKDVAQTQYGRGRVGFVDSRDQRLTRFTIAPHGREEGGAFERAVRSIVWAANREPDINIGCLIEKDKMVSTRGLPALKVALSNRGKEAFKGTAEIVLRQALDMQYPRIYYFYYTNGAVPWFEERARIERPLALNPKMRESLDVPLPTVPAGKYYLHVTARDAEGRVAGWVNQPFEVTADVTVEEIWLSKPGIEPVRADSKTAQRPVIGLKPSETLTAKIAIVKGAGAGATRCNLRLIDGPGRVIFDQTQPLSAAGEQLQSTFRVPMASALHRQVTAVATALDGDKPVAEERAFIPMWRHPERYDSFRFTQLDNEEWMPFNAAGIQEYNNGSSFDRFIECAAQDMQFQGFGGQVVRAKVGKDGIRPFCFNNPEDREKQFEETRNKVGYYRQFGRHGHLLVDEYGYGGLQVCSCQYCKAAFAKYLQRSYKDINELNTYYGARYRTWTDVPIYKIPEKEVVPRQDWPKAIDVCRWRVVQMTDYAKDVAKVAHALMPELRIGFSGCGKMSPSNGQDFWEQSQVGRYHIIYRDWEEWASFVGPLNVRQWRWYQRKYNPSNMRWDPWSILLRGEPGTGIFTSPRYPQWMPDGRLYAGPKAWLDQMREINRGLGKLLLGHDAKDGIGVHWSSHSFFVYGMERYEGVAKYGKCKRHPEYSAGACMDWPRRVGHFLAGASGGPNNLMSNYVSHAQLESGSLGLWGTPKVIFLSYSPAMTQAEADTLKKFVQNGGTLVGGVCPASRSPHGWPYTTPLLNEVFGVKQNGRYEDVVYSSGRPAESITAEEKDTVQPGIPVTLRAGFLDEAATLYPLVLGPSNITVAGATAYGSYMLNGRPCPAVLVNNYGRGKAIYLNFLPLHMNELTRDSWTDETADVCRRLVQRAVEMAGVKPWATVETRENGETAPGGAKLNRFEDGKNVYLGVQVAWGRSPGWHAGRTVTVKLREQRHVYDTRAGKYIGRTDTLTPDFGVEKLAHVYACLPYRVTSLDATVPATAKAGEKASLNVRVGIEGGAAGRHVIRLDVAGPDGADIPKYGYSFEAPNGSGTGDIYFALNDTPGDYTLRITDIATGVSTTKTLKLSK